MTEQMHAFFKRDWGLVLSVIIVGVIVLTFVGAPRAVSEMIGLVVKTLSPAGYGNDYKPLFLLAGAPAGMFGRGWKIAALLLAAGFIIVLFGGLELGEEPVEVGQTVIGLGLVTSMVAALTRIAKSHFYPDIVDQPSIGKPTEKAAGSIDRTPLHLLLVVGAIAGTAYFAKESEKRELQSATDTAAIAAVEEAVEGAGDAAAAMGDPPMDTATLAGHAAMNAAQAAGEAANDAALQSEFDQPAPRVPFPYSSEQTEPPSDPMNELQYAQRSFNPSFDCKIERRTVHQMICGNESLSTFDRQLSVSFKEKLASTAGRSRATLLSDQRARLAVRDACRTLPCLREWYSAELNPMSSPENEQMP
jgi:uncharacterized protein YecT (DUF1311 family)